MSVYCNFCGICCKLIPVNSEDNILVRDGFQIPNDEFLEALEEVDDNEALNIDKDYVKNIREHFPNTKFYKCKYLTHDNKCFIQDTKPLFCKKFPESPLALVPDDCGFLGEVFIKNQELKRRIRMIKEEILDYQSLINIGDKDSKSYQKIIENLTRFITKYKDFGSNNW